jgi:hypothetical protein
MRASHILMRASHILMRASHILMRASLSRFVYSATSIHEQTLVTRPRLHALELPLPSAMVRVSECFGVALRLPGCGDTCKMHKSTTIQHNSMCHVPSKHERTGMTHVQQHEMLGQQVCHVTWALSTMRRTPKGSMEAALVAGLQRTAESLTVQAVANIIWAVGHMKGWGDFGANIWDAVHAVAARRAGEANGQSVANMLWAASRLRPGAPRDALVQALCHRVGHVRHEMQHLHVSMAFVGLARLNMGAPHPVIGTLCERAENMVLDFQAQSTSNVLWALAKINVRRPKLFLALVRRLQDGQAVYQARPTLFISVFVCMHARMSLCVLLCKGAYLHSLRKLVFFMC